MGAAGFAAAQPDPSFRTTCAGLRGALAALPPVVDEETVVTIQVQGEVTAARKDDAVAYIVVCAPPDPQVACITYSLEGRAVGDRVTVSGAYSPAQPDRIVLDPCLHFAAEKAP